MNHSNPPRRVIRNTGRSYHNGNTGHEQQHESKDFDENKHKKKELKINKWGLFVNAFLAGSTLVVLWFTFDQIEISNKALKLTEESLNQQKKTDSADNKQDSAKFVLDSISVDAQIAALNAAKDQFSSEHENFLEIRDIQLTFENVAKNPIIKYTLVNYGSTVLVTYSRFGADLNSLYDSLSVKKNAQSSFRASQFIYNPVYVSEHNPRPQESEWDINLGEFKKRINDPFVFFINGEVKYISLINKQKMVMRYLVRTKQVNKVSFTILSIDNYKDK